MAPPDATAPQATPDEPLPHEPPDAPLPTSVPSAASPSDALAPQAPLRMEAADVAAVRRWRAQIEAAAADGRALRIAGGGSKAFLRGAAAGVHGSGDPVDSIAATECRGIVAYEPSELVVTARAGTPLVELEAALDAERQQLAFEPPRHRDAASAACAATVGGMVAAGLAGPARAVAGGVRDHLLGATMIDGRGRLLAFGGQVMKNVAGYDVSRALAGSMGQLGVIVDVSLKVLPKPPATTTLRFQLDQAEAILRLNEWGGRPLPLQASAWWQGMLVVRLAGAQAAVRSAAAALGGERLDDDLAATFWRDLRDQRDEFFELAARRGAQSGAMLWRLSVPSTTPPLALPGHPLVEWGGALRWIVSDQPAASIHAAAQAAGGHARAWPIGRRDAGFDRAALAAPRDPALHAIEQRLVAAFDPHGVFAPQRTA